MPSYRDNIKLKNRRIIKLFKKISVIKLLGEYRSPVCYDEQQLAAQTAWAERVAKCQRNIVRTTKTNITNVLRFLTVLTCE